MKKNLKKIINYKYFNVCLILFSILVSLFWVTIIDNIHYFKNDFKGNEEVSDVTYSLEDNNLIVDIKTDKKYIYELEFDGENKTKDYVYYNSYAVIDGKDVLLQQEKLSNIYDDKDIIHIGKNTSEIKLIFTEVNSDDVNLSNLIVSNTYQINILKMLVIGVSLYLLLDLLSIIFKDKKPKLYLYFLKISILTGFIIAILSPMYYSLDEKEHFVRAYNVSEFNLIKTKNDKVNWPVLVGPVIDNPYTINIPSTYRAYVNNLKYLDEISKKDYALEVHNSSAEPYLFPGYLISGVGIFVGKIMGLSFPYQFYLGRIFNTVFYALIVAFAIKLCKKYAKIIFALGLIPGLVFQSASYSADMFTNAFALLAVALTIYYRDKKEKVNLKNLIILTFCYLMVFITKIAYFPIVLLIYLIPNSKFKNEKVAKLTKIIIPLIGGFVFGLASLYAKHVGIVQWPVEGANTVLQLKYIITNPFKYIYTMYKTLQSGLVAIINVLATNLGACGNMGEIDFLLIIGILVMAIASSNEDLRKMDKFVLILIVLSSIVAGMSSMYLSFNPVGNNFVEGFQGRYLAPVLLPFLLLFTSSKFKIDIEEKKILIVLISVMVLLNVHAIVTIFLNVYN